MSLSQSPEMKSGASSSAISHIHVADELCPTCDQPIPHDRFDEIKERIEARQSAREMQITTRLVEDFGRQKAEAVEQAKQEAAASAAAQVASAREEERRAAEAATNQKLAEAERVNKDALATMQTRIEQAEAAKSDAQAQIDQVRRENADTIQKMKQDAEAKETAIREDEQKKAEAGVQEKLAGMERLRQESETALQARVKEAEDGKTAAQQSNAALQDQLTQARADNAVAIEKAKQEATAAAETAMQEKIIGAEQAKTEAEAKLLAAEEQKRQLQESHNAQLEQRLQEQRDALARAQTDAVNAEKQTAFERELKLQTKVDDLQRTLDNKTAEELGEGAEIDLYEVLKGEFEGDKIERINKGQPGADILHTVMHNGKECGSIIYDSKNHNAWRNEFVTKLAADQMGARADHAILSTRKFPAGTRHLHVQDGVILATPARVAALVQIVRQHVVQTHALRLSDEARTQKTAALYSFITSQRCNDLFARIDTHADDLLDMQVKEKKAHETMWKKQGELIRSVQKVRAEICNEIEVIVGTAEACEQIVNE